MRAFSCSSAFCLLAICGLLLRSQALISAARSPNYETSDPSAESTGISNELNIVIGLLVFLLVFPVFMVMILLPRAQSVLRRAVALLSKLCTKSFSCVIFEQASIFQSKERVEESGSPEDFENAVGSLKVTDVDFSRSKSLKTALKMAQPVTLNDVHVGGIDLFEGSEIATRRTALPH
jgi:hypothetical protein